MKGASVNASRASKQWKSIIYPNSLRRRSLGQGPTGSYSSQYNSSLSANGNGWVVYFVSIISYIDKPTSFQSRFECFYRVHRLANPIPVNTVDIQQRHTIVKHTSHSPHLTAAATSESPPSCPASRHPTYTLPHTPATQ